MMIKRTKKTKAKPKGKTTAPKARLTVRKKKTKLKPKATVLMRSVGLENLKAPKGAHKKAKLLGRGPGSGHGDTSTRGNKGQSSRSGRDFYLGFEGAQIPLIKRIPKRGFSNFKFKTRYQVVNLRDLAKIKESVVQPQILKDSGLIKNKNQLIKILGEGELKQPLEIKAHAFSKQAKLKIEKAGGKAEIINTNA